MKLLFDKSNNGADELRELTGSYFANNDFTKIRTDALLESERMIDLVGEGVYDRAANHYHGSRYLAEEPTAEEQLNDDLVQHLQLPISLMASIKFYQANLVSHEDAGRKVKIDEANEKMAWEWMLEKDDDAHFRKAYATIDRLIRFLDKKALDEWKDSDQKKATRALLINSTEAFNDIYPIDNSPRFYYSTLPFNREVQREVIRKVLGAKYDLVLEYFQDPPALVDDTLARLLNLAQLAIPIHVMLLAVKRFPVQVLPTGVVQQFKSMSQFSSSASQPAEANVLKAFITNMEKDAAKALNNLVKEVKKLDPTAGQYQFLPVNDPANKYFRT